MKYYSVIYSNSQFCVNLILYRSCYRIDHGQSVLLSQLCCTASQDDCVHPVRLRVMSPSAREWSLLPLCSAKGTGGWQWIQSPLSTELDKPTSSQHNQRRWESTPLYHGKRIELVLPTRLEFIKPKRTNSTLTKFHNVEKGEIPKWRVSQIWVCFESDVWD